MKPAGTSKDSLKTSLAEIAGDLNSDLADRDREAAFPRSAWNLCAGTGLLKLTVPSEYGGLGLGAREAVEVMECFGEICEDAGLVFAVSSVLWSCIMPVVWFGSEEQRRKLLPALCDGSLIAANAMTETVSGSDAFSLRSVARPVEDGYLVSGEKNLISNAPVADLFLFYARSEDTQGPFAISAFLIEGDAPGLVNGPPLHTMGLRTATMGSLRLEDCHVERSQLLGSPGAGMAIFSRAMTWERGCSFATAVGVMERQLKRCVERANGRERFGSSIGSFQAVSHRLADMRVRAVASRLLIEHWAAEQDRGRDATIEASIAKLFASESLIQSSTSAIEISGGEGYLDEHPSERELRDALAGRIYGGTSEVQRNMIAADMGLA